MIWEFLLYLIFGAPYLVYVFYKWATANNEYFVGRKLKALKPVFLLGNTGGLFTKQYRPNEWMDSIYYKYPEEKIIGMFDSRKPVYMARDVEFIKQVTIKDFDYFEDHQAFIDSSADSLFGNSLFLLEGKKWRDMRATLSPAFTGSKMRNMFELVLECADDMSKHLLSEAKQGKPVRWEMKEMCSRFTSDVIASCAFGLKVNSMKDPSNEFFTMGTSNLNFAKTKVAVRLVLLRVMPQLMKSMGFELFPTNVKKFFKSMVLDTMKEREEKDIIRHDMINILMQVRKGNLNHNEEDNNAPDAGFATTQESHIGKIQVKRSWTDDEIIAQCFLFFAAGFDTASTLISFLMYELALNQNIQQKLYEEIREVNENLNGSRLSYDTLPKLKYLDQVISETLRKWPPALFTNRVCTKDYNCDIEGYERFIIEKGKAVWIPIISIHRDPNYYPEPEKFDPERFNDENKHNINPAAFLPFGVGPRNCIGSRFALMEIKAIVYYIILNLSFQPYEKTQIPVKIAKSAANWVTERGIDLEFKPRNS